MPLMDQVIESGLVNEILQATTNAMNSVRNPRFYKSERGYQGRFYYALQDALDDSGIINDKLILEMEYQKAFQRHGMRQRPDIILHIPVEISGADESENNFAVWALKLRANQDRALEDFEKLDYMFSTLHYPLGFFINLDSGSHHLQHYPGDLPERMFGFAVRVINGNITIRMARWLKGDWAETEL